MISVRVGASGIVVQCGNTAMLSLLRQQQHLLLQRGLLELAAVCAAPHVQLLGATPFGLEAQQHYRTLARAEPQQHLQQPWLQQLAAQQSFAWQQLRHDVQHFSSSSSSNDGDGSGGGEAGDSSGGSPSSLQVWLSCLALHRTCLRQCGKAMNEMNLLASSCFAATLKPFSACRLPSWQQPPQSSSACRV